MKAFSAICNTSTPIRLEIEATLDGRDTRHVIVFYKSQCFLAQDSGGFRQCSSSERAVIEATAYLALYPLTDLAAKLVRTRIFLGLSVFGNLLLCAMWWL